MCFSTINIQGIGRAIAKRLIQHGATVYALSKSFDNLKSLQKEVAGIHIININLEDWVATQKAVEEIGPVDLLVNNAGVAVLESFLDIKPESFDRFLHLLV